MNVNFDQDPVEEPSGGRDGKSRLPLLVLLLLIVVFGYIYFFTGLIRTQEEAPKQAPVQTSQVKQPIPPRPEQQAAGKSPEPAQKPEAPKAGEQEKAAPASPAAKQPVPKAEPAKPEAAKSAKADVTAEKKTPAKPAETAKAVAKPQEKKDEKVVSQEKPKAAVKEPAKSEARVAASEKTKAPVKGKEKKEVKVAAAGKAKPSGDAKAVKAPATTGKSGKTAGTGEYTIKIGDYVVATAMESDKEKVRAAGLSPEVRKGAKKKEPMFRLYLGEFPDQETARKELEKLRNATVDGFVLKENGKYRVYAGSYFLMDGATREQERIAAQGIKLSIKKAAVSVPTFTLTAGKFATRDAAQKESAKLRKQGLKPVVVENSP